MKFDDDDSAQPIYEHPPDKYSAEEIIKILLDPPKDKICYVKPTLVTKSAAYIVDTSCLHNLEDIKKDSYGIWKYSGSHPQTFKVYTEDDGYKVIEKCSKGASGSNVVYLRRLHCTHPSNSDFKRLICFLSGRSNKFKLSVLTIFHIFFILHCRCCKSSTSLLSSCILLTIRLCTHYFQSWKLKG